MEVGMGVGVGVGIGGRMGGRMGRRGLGLEGGCFLIDFLYYCYMGFKKLIE